MLAHSEKPHRVRPLFISSATQSPATNFHLLTTLSRSPKLLAGTPRVDFKACSSQPYTAGRSSLPTTTYFRCTYTLWPHSILPLLRQRLHEEISERPTSTFRNPAPPHSPNLLSVSLVRRDSYQLPLNLSSVICTIFEHIRLVT